MCAKTWIFFMALVLLILMGDKYTASQSFVLSLPHNSKTDINLNHQSSIILHRIKRDESEGSGENIVEDIIEEDLEAIEASGDEDLVLDGTIGIVCNLRL